MQYNKIKFAVGVFVTILLIVMVSSFYFVLNEKGFFDKRYNFSFNIKSAKSFSVGMPLEFSGFNIGVVDDISLNDNATVEIVFSVDEQNRKWLREGSYLRIVKPLIGSPYIEVNSDLSRDILAEDSRLEIIQSDDINDMISKLDPMVKKIITIIDSIETITSSLASGDSDLMKTFANLNKFSEKLSKSDSLLTSVTGDEKSTKALIDALNELNQSMKNIKNITNDVSKISTSFDEKVIEPASQSTNNLNEIMLDIREKLKVIDATVHSVGGYDEDLVEVKEQISVAIEKSNQLMDKVDSLMQDSQTKEVQLP
ncbi:MCE family protein [Sulfurimonas aquatica]|uniref:MCE family protein n=1 Tax=Sulfurimonas aquatica TaxID=2672570 RepID=A0A975AZN1_9BACT|nr:MlaD family protein [Sulfurimonas aquatica]QSZ41517.1 MCE family protein [Sulfurimonas aquatica]